MSRVREIESVKLEKFVHGGQALGVLPDGKKLLVWGGLPGEIVSVKLTKNRSSYAEGVVASVEKQSTYRIAPKEPDSYLSTSPWQILEYSYENKQKQLILKETFKREGIESVNWSEFYTDAEDFAYRNKIEIGFWGDDNGLHLAHYRRGSHGKQIVEENLLATDEINVAAREVRDELNRLGIWAGKLKTLLLRVNQQGEVVAALFTKEDLRELSNFTRPKSLKGIDIYYSNPKSPASVATKKLYSYGDITLMDSIAGKNIIYDVLSFFQVNLPVFERALSDIQKQLNNTIEIKIVDMYSGVGAIGVSVGADILVESDDKNVTYAKKNTSKSTEVVHATSEDALEYITDDSVILVDPPRAGLHKKVVERINETKPQQIVYLSCNPVTQSRDIKMLADNYKIIFARGYNFFPRTPHIESLVVLERK